MNRWAAIARFGGIGDNLIASSPLKALKRMGYMTEVITSPPAHTVFLHNPHIDKLSIKLVERDLPQGDLAAWQGWIESRAREYDVFGHFSHSCEGRHSVFPAMTTFWLPEEYRRKVCAGNYLETVHDIVNAPYEFGPLFHTSEDERTMADKVKKQMGERVVGWIISGTRIDKVYPYSAMAIARIIREIGVPVVIFGGPGEKELSMAHAIRDHVERQNGSRKDLHLALPDGDNLARAWPIRTTLALVQACDLVVSPDTGPAWACAFEPMPKVILISHGSVENVTKHWINTTTLHADPDRVPCWPCHRLHDNPSTCVENKESNGAACISDITVERVVEAVARAWRGEENVVHAERLFAGAGLLDHGN